MQRCCATQGCGRKAVLSLQVHTAITERTRKICILSSMDGSQSFVVGGIETEASVLSILGIGLDALAAIAINAAHQDSVEALSHE